MKIFGFNFSLNNNREEVRSVVPQEIEESSIDINAYGGIGGNYINTFNMDQKLIGPYTENVSIQKCREISTIPLVDKSIEEIVSDAIVVDGKESPVSMNLDEVQYTDAVKKEIQKSFDNTMKLLHFDIKGYDIFRKWYIDGRIVYHVLIDENNPKKGVVEVRNLDPRKIKKVREFDGKDQNQALNVQLYSNSKFVEYYIYSPVEVDNVAGVQSPSHIRIAKDSIAFAPSGLTDLNTNMVVSHLYKAIRPANTQRMMEDSAVIYRLNNSTERRIFYIDVGNLPTGKAKQYLEQISTKYKNKLAYDVGTGQLRDDRRFLAMTEDFWLPRREGSRGTQIDTLPAGQNLGVTEDLEYFKQNTIDALNVPRSRFNQETMLSRGTEISRDELKFASFIQRLRSRFNFLFLEIIQKDLVLRGVMSVEDWDKIRNDIKFDYNRDNRIAEMFEGEVLRERLSILQDIENYEGKYFSREYIQRSVLKMSDDEIEQEKKRIEEEKTMYKDEQDDEDSESQGNF